MLAYNPSIQPIQYPHAPQFVTKSRKTPPPHRAKTLRLKTYPMTPTISYDMLADRENLFAANHCHTWLYVKKPEFCNHPHHWVVSCVAANHY